MALAVFDAMVASRNLDLAARYLRKEGPGVYTIGSAGHESNAAIAAALRPSDPALLHYRSGGFYCARAQQVPGATPLQDVLLGLVAAADEPISGGRHKVFGNHALSVIPQTSTIASHLPRAMGVGFAIERAQRIDVPIEWPADAIVVCSFGDASLNQLAQACYAGDMTSCDTLFDKTKDDPGLQHYTDYGDSCAGRQETGTQLYCTDAFPG